MSKVEDFIVEADPLMRDLLEAKRRVFDAEHALVDYRNRLAENDHAAKTVLAEAWREEALALERWLHKDV